MVHSDNEAENKETAMGFYAGFGRRALRAAHRGWRTVRPENTLPAFEAALGHFDLIELDLQLSRDDAWVVCHDESLERTTDVEERFPGGLRPHRLTEYSLEELRRLDAGSWFLRRDPYGTLASGESEADSLREMLPLRLPTLREVLAFARRHAMPLNLEIKEMPCRTPSSVVDQLLAALERESSLPPLILSSFEHRYLDELRRRSPRLPLAALVEQTHPPRLTDYLVRLGVEAYHVEDSLADTTPVEELSQHGIACAVYTVNDPGRARELFDRGFVAVFCDHPLEIPGGR